MAESKMEMTNHMLPVSPIFIISEISQGIPKKSNPRL